MPVPSHGRGGSEAARAGPARFRVAAVDSSPIMLDLIGELLQEARYDVATAGFRSETFARVAALAPDLLIVDLAVGVRAGWELLERLAADADTRCNPVIVTSTDPTLLAQVRAEPARWGGQRFLVKPFDLDALLQAVRELIEPAEPLPSGAASPRYDPGEHGGGAGMASQFTTETIRIAPRRPPAPAREVVVAEVVDEPAAPASPDDGAVEGNDEAIEVEGRDVPDEIVLSPDGGGPRPGTA